jgi:hypothetical protein
MVSPAQRGELVVSCAFLGEALTTACVWAVAEQVIPPNTLATVTTKLPELAGEAGFTAGFCTLLVKLGPFQV